MLDLWERNAVPFLSDAGFELLNSPGSLLYLGFLGAPNISMCVVQHCLTKICRAFPKKKQKNNLGGSRCCSKTSTYLSGLMALFQMLPVL